jgi:hypothetical protein
MFGLSTYIVRDMSGGRVCGVGVVTGCRCA